MTTPNRAHLYQETHARPYLHLPVPCAVAHLLYWKGDSQSMQLLDLAKNLAQRQGVTPSAAQQSFFEYRCQNYHIRFEQHTEFDTLTIAQSLQGEGEPFAVNPLSIVDESALAEIEPDVLVKTRIHLLGLNDNQEGGKKGNGTSTADHVQRQFSDINGGALIYGAWVMERRAQVYTDFRLDAQGYSRYLAVSHSLNSTDAGRLVTRLIEMENYRILALLPLADARAINRELAGIDNRLAQILSAISDDAGDDDVQAEAAQGIEHAQAQHRRLDELLEIAKTVESYRNSLASRFSASFAYYQIVKFSYDKLHEEKLGSLQRMQTFVERRLGPATRTFESMRQRLDDISQRIERIAELLRTEINLQMQLQSSEMLAGMNHSAKMQLKMQKTVEGISIVALTYYAVGVVGYFLSLFLHGDDKYAVMGGLVLPIALTIWYVQKKLVHRIIDGKK